MFKPHFRSPWNCKNNAKAKQNLGIKAKTSGKHFSVADLYLKRLFANNYNKKRRLSPHHCHPLHPSPGPTSLTFFWEWERREEMQNVVWVGVQRCKIRHPINFSIAFKYLHRRDPYYVKKEKTSPCTPYLRNNGNEDYMGGKREMWTCGKKEENLSISTATMTTSISPTTGMEGC